MVPFVSYWWPSFPEKLSREAFRRLPRSDQRTFRVAHHAPWLLHWWMSQKWFPTLSFTADTSLFCADDLEYLKTISENPAVGQVYISVIKPNPTKKYD